MLRYNQPLAAARKIRHGPRSEFSPVRSLFVSSRPRLSASLPTGIIRANRSARLLHRDSDPTWSTIVRCYEPFFVRLNQRFNLMRMFPSRIKHSPLSRKTDLSSFSVSCSPIAHQRKSFRPVCSESSGPGRLRAEQRERSRSCLWII